ncbi:MAG: ATP-binding protein [Mycoplasmataceae bacterium]|nr:ATP-binding protein [Mycoplasmataceae bacterium]
MEWKDKDVIKVVTGVRRCGKSTILSQYENEIRTRFKISDEQIITYDFNDDELSKMSESELHKQIIVRSNKNKVNYLFLDEIQEIKDFEKCVISLYSNKKIKFDIYLTGSNSKMFSSSLATLFTGRNQEIRVYPLSFSEFYNYAKENTKLDRIEIFNTYMELGGMPIILNELNNTKNAKARLSSVLFDSINKDVKNRHHIKTFPEFSRFTQYVYENIGHIMSTRSISAYIKSNNSSRTSHKTIDRYLGWLCEALLLYKVDFFNTTGKRILQTSGKYYSVDNGIRNAQNNFNMTNDGSLLENIVYIELLRRGYSVTVGKLRDGREIDFVAVNGNQTTYFQVTQSLNSPTVREREIGNLRSIKNSFRKIVLSQFDRNEISADGIQIINLIDWLLEE